MKLNSMTDRSDCGGWMLKKGSYWLGVDPVDSNAITHLKTAWELCAGSGHERTWS